MYQGTALNFGSQPVARGQTQPAPTVVASGADVSGLQDQIDALTTRLDAAEATIVTLQTQVADHETRIAALEP